MKKMIILVLLMLSMQVNTFAGQPDWGGLLQKISSEFDQLLDICKILGSIYGANQLQLQELHQLEDEIKALNTGHYGYGIEGNNAETVKNWQSPAETWDDALHHLSGGNESRYKDLVNAYEKNHTIFTQAKSVMSKEEAHQFEEDRAVNRAVQVEAADTYNQINKHIASLHRLSESIESTENTKGAIDLNSRLVAEMGFIQLMQSRLNTLMNQQLSQDSQSSLQARAEMTLFNQLPDDAAGDPS